jgi:heme exporter protein A
VLEAAGLECERGGRSLFRALSFVLEPGQALRVAGANGSGKTSLLRILCGLAAPAAGEVRWRGAPIARLREDFARELVYIGHGAAVKDELTARENLGIACRLAGQEPSHAELEQALQAFGVGGRALAVKRLSQGQRRRAALARLALSARRRLWLLDEPFSALDSSGVQTLQRVMAEHLARGGAIVLTSHQDAGIAAAQTVELG